MCIKLIISDFDGTLVNTFYANFSAYKKAFEQLNLKISEQEYKQVFGFRFDKFMSFMGIEEESIRSQIKELKSKYYPDFFYLLQPNVVLANFIKCFHNNGGKTILASTASKENLLNVLNYLNINDIFDVLLTAGDVKNGKPDPEVYLKAIGLYSYRADEILVFEDSEVGFESVKKAGLSFVKIGNGWYENQC